MITIRLLGPIQKTFNMNTLYVDRAETSMVELLSYLREKATQPDLVEEKNFLIAINGIEYSLIPKSGPIVKSGDVVTIASLVHGG